MPPHAADLLPRLRQLAVESGGLSPGESLLVALSGGIDSVALLDLLLRWREAEPRRIVALHVNHRLRRRSEADEAHCRALCAERDVALHVVHEDVAALAESMGLGIEAAARAVRYERLQALRSELALDSIVTAHHRDDHIETLLLWLFRGTGLCGMHGIRARSAHLVRPLRGFDRTQIEAYARWRRLRWREDESNSQPRFVRNRVRHELLPLLNDVFGPSAGAQLLGFAQRAADDSSLLDELVADLLAAVLLPDPQGRLRLSLSRWRELEPRLQRLCLRQLLLPLVEGSAAPQRLDAADWARLAAFSTAAGAGRSTPIPGLGWLRVGRQEIELELAPGRPDPVELLLESLPAPGPVLNLGERTAYFDADQLRFPLRLRALLPGDRMQPQADRSPKRLVDLLREGQVPSWRRACTLVVEDAERIIWAIGHAVDASTRPTGQTQRVLRAMIASRPG
jgi:tRNA(Ile)-lysidine synthase